MKVADGIKNAAKTSGKVWQAIRSGESSHSAKTKKALVYGSIFLAGASVCALAAGMYLKASAKNADQHAAWKHEDKKLDDAINASLDASDPVAKY